MGAYGCALIAMENASDDATPSTILALSDLEQFKTTKEFTTCGLCENMCKMTLTVFNDGSKFVSGNRCERGAEKAMQIKVDKAEKKLTSLTISIKNFSNLNH